MEEDIFKVGLKIILKPIPPGERAPNRTFLSLNRIEDRLRPGEASGPEDIMRKDTTTAKLTQREKERNKKIAKKRYIATPGGIKSIDIMRTDNTNYANKRYKVEDIHNTIPPGEKQYFGLSHLHDGAYRARFTTTIKNIWDAMCRQTCPVKCEAYFTGVAFNITRGSKLLATA